MSVPPGGGAPDGGVSVAVFNGHGGVDGWGRPYDFWGAFHRLDADVVVLPELFFADGESAATERAAAPYRLVTTELARARLVRHEPAARAAGRWGPSVVRRAPRALRLEGPPRSRRAALRPAERGMPGVRGSWRLGVATRLPLLDAEVLDLPQLRRDPARRRAVVVRVGLPGDELVVAGTHLGHISHGAWRQVRALGAALAGRPVAVIGGDMNCWGAPLLALLPGWRRAVRARSWPAWRPHSQIDHLLFRGPLRVGEAGVLADAGSDHRPVRARLVPVERDAATTPPGRVHRARP